MQQRTAVHLAVYLGFDCKTCEMTEQVDRKCEVSVQKRSGGGVTLAAVTPFCDTISRRGTSRMS
jgi:hypothetical protein